MTPQNRPEAVDALAAEYVLGTLRGAARRRFETWLGSTPLAQDRLRFWEQHLVTLLRTVRPVRPPAHVWDGVRARLNLPAAQPSRHPGQQPRRRPAHMWAIAAGVVLVAVLAGVLYQKVVSPGPVTEVARIETPEGVRYWDVDIYDRSGRMVVHAGQPARPGQRAYELWALPTGGKPVSLGVLPVAGERRLALSTDQQHALAVSQQLAVTIEAVGGSATGQPTSKPVFVAPLRKVS